LVAAFLADYLALVEGDSAHRLDLKGVRLLEADVPTWSRRERASAGVIAELPVRRSGRLTVFVRIEPQPGSDGAKRLGRFVLDLLQHHERPVLASAVFLRGGHPGAHLCTVGVAHAAGLELLRLFYTGFGLSEARAEYYLDRPEPLAWALAAAMRPCRLSPDELRGGCLDRIASSDLPPERKKILSGFVRSAGLDVRGAGPPASAGGPWERG